MTDIIIFDQLADLKRLTADEAFLTLERRFQKERGRYLAKMLDEKTTPEETIAVKAVVNALESVSPMALAESTLKVEVANVFGGSVGASCGIFAGTTFYHAWSQNDGTYITIS